jgi:outer membrane protein assembly factor BamB
MRSTMQRAIPTIFLLALSLGAADTDWPSYRGPYTTGVAATSAPVEWGDTENIKWKVDIPGKGNSSPAVWGDRIFLTTAIAIGKAPEPVVEEPPAAEQGRRRRRPSIPLVEQKFVVMALDRNTGKVVWEKVAKVATPHEGYHHRYGSFASNSPVTDGEHVIASFGSRGIYCYDMDGNLVWEKDYGLKMVMAGTFGEGTAPTLAGDTLLVKHDFQGDSFIAALNKKTGEEIWRTERDERSSWSQPLVIEHDGRQQVVTSASNRIRGYDLKTGEEIWECGGLGSNVIPAPIYYQGVVLAMSGHRSPNLVAVKLKADGDLTDTDAVLWSTNRGTSYTPSPVLHEGKYYVLTDSGMISCLDAITGEEHYKQQRLPKPYNFKASPVAAGGHLYLSSEDEDVIVLKLGEEYEVVATNTMTDQTFIATPAVSDGEMFLRSTTTLYCVSDK